MLLADPNGQISPSIISRIIALNPGDTLKLQITDDLGVQAAAPIPVAAPVIAVHPSDGIVRRGQTITIRGRNFPPNRSDYWPPFVTVKVAGRAVAGVYPNHAGGWTVSYHRTRHFQPGQSVRIDASLGDYPLTALTHHLRLRVPPTGVTVAPQQVQIDTPITVTVSGLEPYTARYGVKIRNGPYLTFDGSTSFTTDRYGRFTGKTLFPVYVPYAEYGSHAGYASHAFNPNRSSTISLRIVQSNVTIPARNAPIVLLPGRYSPPTPTATPTPPRESGNLHFCADALLAATPDIPAQS